METKGNFYKLLEWLYLKMDADNKKIFHQSKRQIAFKLL